MKIKINKEDAKYDDEGKKIKNASIKVFFSCDNSYNVEQVESAVRLAIGEL